jgi:hypothetical protein
MSKHTCKVCGKQVDSRESYSKWEDVQRSTPTRDSVTFKFEITVPCVFEECNTLLGERFDHLQ